MNYLIENNNKYISSNYNAVWNSEPTVIKDEFIVMGYRKDLTSADASVVETTYDLSNSNYLYVGLENFVIYPSSEIDDPTVDNCITYDPVPLIYARLTYGKIIGTIGFHNDAYQTTTDDDRLQIILYTRVWNNRIVRRPMVDMKIPKVEYFYVPINYTTLYNSWTREYKVSCVTTKTLQIEYKNSLVFIGC